MRRALGVLGVVFFLAPIQPAEAHFIAEVGFRAHAPTLAHRLTPEPSPAPTMPSPAASTGGGPSWLSATQVASYARAAGFPSSAIPQMVAYAYRESHYNAHAINLSSGACGLWQIWPCPGLQALDPATNAALAYAKFRASGFSPWGG